MASQSNPPRPLPTPVKIAGSVLALWHLLAVGLLALGAPSGPWPTKFGLLQADGPRFAQSLNNSLTYPYYLEPLRMSHNYHFDSNRVQAPGAYFEVTLRNEIGVALKTLKFPDDKASFAVRHRQEVLAKALAADMPPVPVSTQRMAPKGKSEEKIEVWEPRPDGVFKMVEVAKSDAQERQLSRPSSFSKVLAQSYMRYLCREHKAASAELIRHTQQQAIPTLLFIPGAAGPDDFVINKNHFGDFRRE